jgi:acetylornithine/succinyldiaminopimelate/putrescine aminotransferase
VVQAALDRGLLVNRTAETVIRLPPPFVATAGDVARMAALLDQSLDAVCRRDAHDL